jgi:predicted amidohydrolase YtcJ
MIFRRVEIGGAIVDALVENGDGAEVDGAGGALIPGLWDHHIHLRALAAAEQSVRVPDLRAAAAARAPGEWIRAIGYHEFDHGELDRDVLDRLVPDHPVRVQHASGTMWVLNSAALRAVGSDEPSGRLFGRDRWLYDRLGGAPPDLAEVAGTLTAAGVTGVTDATPGLTELPVDGLPLRVELLGDSKIVVAEHEPPDIDDLADRIRSTRPAIVAIHCASRMALVLALAALDAAGARPGDRIEHGAVIPDDAVPTIGRLGLTVVTQPAFVHERGDRYLAEVDADDRPFLWRCGSLLRAGIRVAGSSDAPHGPADPWAAIRAATKRRTAAGLSLGADEAITAAEALALFAPPAGMPTGLCLLRATLTEMLASPDASMVRATFPGDYAAVRVADANSLLSASNALTSSAR